MSSFSSVTYYGIVSDNIYAERKSGMKNKPKLAVLGGDLRQYALARRISELDACVCTCGLCVSGCSENKIEFCESFEDAVSGAAAVVLPLPVSTDERTLNCPALRCAERITLAEVVRLMDKGAMLLGGRIPQKMRDMAGERGIEVLDYFLSESLQIENAYITAEAAVSIAMNALDKTLRGAHLAITGSGRIARFLSRILQSLGAGVTVAARNANALAYFAAEGCGVIEISERSETSPEASWYSGLTRGYDVIFNTVPAWLFDRGFLERVDSKTLIIELASSPGGIDICAARELDSNVIWAPSLPGKYAPMSAGQIIADHVVGALRGRI